MCVSDIFDIGIQRRPSGGHLLLALIGMATSSHFTKYVVAGSGMELGIIFDGPATRRSPPMAAANESTRWPTLKNVDPSRDCNVAFFVSFPCTLTHFLFN